MQPIEVDRLLMKPTQQRRVGRYVLLGKIGHGGMGKIYLAFQPGPGGIERLVVIKRLHSHLRKDQKLVTNFLDEARLSMALNHPNVVHTYDVGEEHKRTYMVLEFIDGQNLGVILRTAKKEKKYPEPAFWAFIMMAVLDGLFHAHNATDARERSLKMIHRDISPQNILIGYDGVPKLVDFGIAKASMRLSETDAGVLKGKYAYMSPEQVKGEPLDHRSDLFAVGIVLWECFTGRRLYKCDSIVQSAERIVDEPPISPLRVKPDCDRALAAVVVKALQKNPNDRFQSAEEFRDALDEALRASHYNPKRKNTRELLNVLFADLRDQQKRLIERCLNLASSDRPMTPVPSDEPLVYDDESGSDFQVPALNLKVNAETTHSAQALPLVTREEDLQPMAATVEERSRNVAALKNKNTLKTTTGSFSSLLVQNDESHASKATSSANAANAGAVVETHSALKESAVFLEKKMRLPPQKIFATAALLAFLLGGFLWWQNKPANLGVNANIEKEPVVEKKIHFDAQKMDLQKVRGLPSESGQEASNPLDAFGGIVKNRPPEAVQKPVKKPAAKAVTKRRARKTKQTLTLDTVPWTDVYLGKKHLGTTPIVNLSVPAGRLRLRLVNAKEGIDKAYEVRIPRGESVRKRLGLK